LPHLYYEVTPVIANTPAIPSKKLCL